MEMPRRAPLTAATGALLVVVLAAVLVLKDDHRGPNADAAGMFPATIAATADLPGGRLLASWASVSPRQDFDFKPQTYKGEAGYFVRCAMGSNITLDFGGSTAGMPCDGTVRGLSGGGNFAERNWVHARADNDPGGRWGVALYALDR